MKMKAIKRWPHCKSYEYLGFINRQRAELPDLLSKH